MNMTDRFNPANENDPKRKLAYGLIALACVIALGFGLDAASCSRTGTAGDEGREQDAHRGGRWRQRRRGDEPGREGGGRREESRGVAGPVPRPPAFGSRASTSSRA